MQIVKGESDTGSAWIKITHSSRISFFLSTCTFRKEEVMDGGVVISVDKYSDAVFSNTAKYDLARTTTTKSDQCQSIVQTKTQNPYRKSPEVSTVTLVRMTQLAPDATTIDGIVLKFRNCVFFFR